MSASVRPSPTSGSLNWAVFMISSSILESPVDPVEDSVHVGQVVVLGTRRRVRGVEPAHADHGCLEVVEAFLPDPRGDLSALAETRGRFMDDHETTRLAHGGHHDARFHEGSIDDPLVTEVLLQPVRDAEDPAQRADVLPEQHDPGIVLEGLAQSPVDGSGQGRGGVLGPGCLGRGPSSPWRWRAVASWSNLRNRTMDRYMVISSVISRVSSSYPFGDRRSPLGLIICMG